MFGWRSIKSKIVIIFFWATMWSTAKNQKNPTTHCWLPTSSNLTEVLATFQFFTMNIWLIASIHDHTVLRETDHSIMIRNNSCTTNQKHQHTLLKIAPKIPSTWCTYVLNSFLHVIHALLGTGWGGQNQIGVAWTTLCNTYLQKIFFFSIVFSSPSIIFRDINISSKYPAYLYNNITPNVNEYN